MDVFISSVVKNYGQHRAAAKRAVTLLGHKPVMSEDFGARPYSSQEACMTEIDQADVVIVILGADFGFETPTGESVTQQEFRRAKNSGKPILAFLEDTVATGRQQEFRAEVSNYENGLFRGSFADERGLADGIVKALSTLGVSRKALPEQAFIDMLQRRNQAVHSNGWTGSSARFELAFLPQPTASGTLRSMHAQREAMFLKIRQADLCSLKNGYRDFDEEDVTGLDTTNLFWRHHDSGLSWLSVDLTNFADRNDHFRSFYISPSKVKTVSQAAFSILSNGKGGWFQVGLYNLDHRVLREPPGVSSNSFSSSFNSIKQFEERSVLIPASERAFVQWIDEALFRLGRRLSS